LEMGDFTPGLARKETVTGAALKWKKKGLAKGGKWVVEYVLKVPEGVEKGLRLRHAELKALDDRKEKVVAFSNEVVV